METSTADWIRCPGCSRTLPAAAISCPDCGREMALSGPTMGGGHHVGEDPTCAARKPDWEDRPWFVIAIVFGAALFLGYPLLWRTRAFEPRTKALLSVLVVVETIVVFWLFYLVMKWVYIRVTDSIA